MIHRKISPFALVVSSEKIDEKTRKKILAKAKVLDGTISEIERITDISYPTFYVEPTLTITVSTDNFGGIGILYARTIPVETHGRVEILIQISAPLLLYSTKNSLLRVLAHEFLHYLELVRRFSVGNISSETASSSLFEETYTDADRVLSPRIVFPRKRRLIKDLENDFETGFSDYLLNEKCRKNWIENGLPTVKIPMGANQVQISVESLSRSGFDPNVLTFLKKKRGPNEKKI
jgi:hypothetical protein